MGEKQNTAADLVDAGWKLIEPLQLQLGGVRSVLRKAWRDHFGRVCPECNREMCFHSKRRKERNYATIDHIKARGLGGTDALSNLRIICLECNGKKSRIESDEAAKTAATLRNRCLIEDRP